MAPANSSHGRLGAGPADLDPRQILDPVPGIGGAEVVIVPAMQAEQLLPVVCLEHLGQPGNLIVDGAHGLHLLVRILRTEGGVVGEIVQEQLRRLEAEAVGADV